MIGIRKICKNFDEIKAAHEFNAQARYESIEGFIPPKLMKIPDPIYYNVELNFRPSTVEDYFLDTNNDIIIFIRHRGEVRFEYSPVLETKLSTILSLES